METVQAESGVIKPDLDFIKAVRKKCTETGALLIFDEIQAGFGRTGSLWAFSAIEVIPDVLLLGKALGGGMPLGAFITDKKWMDLLTDRPVLGHITTFGGHPVCCAAGLAAFEALLDEKWIEQVSEKEQLLRKALVHSNIISVRSAGLWMGVEFAGAEDCKKVIDYVLERGVLTDWFLFAPNCLRISPPLIIHPEQLKKAASLIVEACDVLL
jgi:acetylornithine/succinyldiaminopimelate/putrescine aminotransferase